VVCPYNLIIAYAENTVQNGARISLDTAVTGMKTEDGLIVSVTTNRGTVYPAITVNTAGVFADEIAAMAGDRFYSIHSRRGINNLTLKGEVCCSLVVVRLRISYPNNALKGRV
jgi:glycerol-3-phosphate dehydrogenase